MWKTYLTQRNKIGDFWGINVNIFGFFKDVSREMKKVTWPKGPELVSYTITVIATVAFVAVFFFIIDFLIAQGLNSLSFLK